MSIATDSVDSSFSSLRSNLEKAYGFGFRPDTPKIAAVIDEALNLTSVAPDLTKEEHEFYRSASKRVSPSVETLASLSDVVEASSVLASNAEKMSQDVRKQFLLKSQTQRSDYLNSDAYLVMVEQAHSDGEMIEETAHKIKDLLFRPEKGSKTNPFKEITSFAEHRQAVSEVYEKAAEIGSRHAAALGAMTPEGLFASVPTGSKVTRAIAKHPYCLSVPIGAGLIAAAAFKLNDPVHKAIGYGLGTLASLTPWIFS